MTESGIVYAGTVIPDTGFVNREPSFWWDERSVRARPAGEPPSQLCWHWTGGPPREGPGAGSSVVRAMKARKPAVSIHFVISWDGLVWQTADISRTTAHAGGHINPRSIGVEICWPGTAKQAETLRVKGVAERRAVAGHSVMCLRPSDAVISASVRLAEALASALPSLPRQVPASASGELLMARMTQAQVRSWRGALEHLHAPGTTKVDAGGYLIEALHRAGWKSVAV
jgi:hypothetical protein